MCTLFKMPNILFWRPSIGFKRQIGRASTLHHPGACFIKQVYQISQVYLRYSELLSIDLVKNKSD